MSVNLQDFSAGSPMWNLVRGYNERRGVLGLPYRAYSGKEWSDVAAIGDAVVSDDSIIQHVNFWNELIQIQPFSLVSSTSLDRAFVRYDGKDSTIRRGNELSIGASTTTAIRDDMLGYLYDTAIDVFTSLDTVVVYAPQSTTYVTGKARFSQSEYRYARPYDEFLYPYISLDYYLYGINPNGTADEFYQYAYPEITLPDLPVSPSQSFVEVAKSPSDTLFSQSFGHATNGTIDLSSIFDFSRFRDRDYWADYITNSSGTPGIPFAFWTFEQPVYLRYTFNFTA